MPKQSKPNPTYRVPEGKFLKELWWVMDAVHLHLIRYWHLESKAEPRLILWMTTKNPHFGGLSPFEMILRGRFKKVKQFIEGALGG